MESFPMQTKRCQSRHRMFTVTSKRCFFISAHHSGFNAVFPSCIDPLLLLLFDSTAENPIALVLPLGGLQGQDKVVAWWPRLEAASGSEVLGELNGLISVVCVIIFFYLKRCGNLIVLLFLSNVVYVLFTLNIVIPLELWLNHLIHLGIKGGDLQYSSSVSIRDIRRMCLRRVPPKYNNGHKETHIESFDEVTQNGNFKFTQTSDASFRPSDGLLWFLLWKKWRLFSSEQVSPRLPVSWQEAKSAVHY